MVNFASLWQMKLVVKSCYQTGQSLLDKNWLKMPKWKIQCFPYLIVAATLFTIFFDIFGKCCNRGNFCISILLDPHPSTSPWTIFDSKFDYFNTEIVLFFKNRYYTLILAIPSFVIKLKFAIVSSDRYFYFLLLRFNDLLPQSFGIQFGIIRFLSLGPMGLLARHDLL